MTPALAARVLAVADMNGSAADTCAALYELAEQIAGKLMTDEQLAGCDAGARHRVELQTDTLDAWCGECGERLLLPGTNGGPPEEHELEPEDGFYRCSCGETFDIDSEGVEYAFAHGKEVRA